MRERLDREYFEGLYAASSDPWRFETSPYERRKYERTLGVLEGRRYARALEAGCSIGVFTVMLAPLCDELLAVDVSEKAVAAAKERLASLPHIRAERLTVKSVSQSGSRRAALDTAMRTRSMAFWVAAWGSAECTQALWLRMLAISTRYLFKPALVRVS